jgi:hypothetical protein|tara:strand:- start:297 stop:1079 length:783 start_codon:yes stop_codon:yes gene_type:complete
MLIDIHLGHNKEYTLTYELFDNRVAKRIWERFQQTDFDYISRTQFYNFGETEQEVRDKLNYSIEKIKQLDTDMPLKWADDLNMLHTNFPDSVKNATGDLRYWWSMFNYHLHHLEEITRYQNKRFLTCTQDQGEPLLEEDYELFSPTRLTNHLYMNYPHVGKHIMELALDDDVDIPADHIVPTSILKNDFVAWFGRSIFVEDPEKIAKDIRRWCVKINSKLPYPIDDKRLSIGHIPLGKLTHEPDLETISKYQYFHSVTCY